MLSLSFLLKKLNQTKWALSFALFITANCLAMHRHNLPNAEDENNFCLFDVNTGFQISDHTDDFNDIYPELPSLDELRQKKEQELQAIKKQEQEIERYNQALAFQRAHNSQSSLSHISSTSKTKKKKTKNTSENSIPRMIYATSRPRVQPTAPITPQALAPFYAIANNIGLEVPPVEQVVIIHNELFSIASNPYPEITSCSSEQALSIYQPLREARMNYVSGNFSRSQYLRAQLNVIQSIANGDSMDINQAPLVQQFCIQVMNFINHVAAQERANRRMIRDTEQEETTFAIAHATSTHFSQEYSAQQNTIAVMNNNTHAILEELNMSEPEAYEITAPQISDLEEDEQAETQQQANVNTILQELAQLRVDMDQILAQPHPQNSNPSSTNTNPVHTTNMNTLRNDIAALRTQLENINPRVYNSADRTWTTNQINNLRAQINNLSNRVSGNWNNSVSYNWTVNSINSLRDDRDALRNRLRDEAQALHGLGMMHNAAKVVNGVLMAQTADVVDNFSQQLSGSNVRLSTFVQVPMSVNNNNFQKLSPYLYASGGVQIVEGVVGFLCSLIGVCLKR